MTGAGVGCWCRAPQDGQESGKEKGDAGCEGRDVSALMYQWEGVTAGQVYLRGTAGAHLAHVQDRAGREGWYRVLLYNVIK